MRRSLSFLALTAASVFAPSVRAEVKLPPIISDHMVLQRDLADPIWGWAGVGEEVKVTIGGQTKTAQPGADGRWQVKLDPFKTAGEPLSLTVQGKNTITVKDVVIGEVWLGSGQSNMVLQVQRANDAEKEMAAAAEHPQLRFFVTQGSTEARLAPENSAGHWLIPTPQNLHLMSAVLWFFGRDVQKEVGGNFGLIVSAVGGTPIESWIAGEAQRQAPELKEDVAATSKNFAAFDPAASQADFEKQTEEWKQRAEKFKAAGKEPPRAPHNPLVGHQRSGDLGHLFTEKIAPLIPYGLRGAIWYQGENNAGSPYVSLYRVQLPLLVNDWRARWGQGDFPFAWVQLPNLDGPNAAGWSLVREAELQTLKLKHTGMAITIDLGEEHNVHPKNKQEVGRRLSLWALSEVYGKKIESVSGPLPAGHEVRKNEVVLSFTHADHGLRTTDGGALKGFTIAGEDGNFVPAVAKIEGDKVVVSSPDLAKPAAARYDWAGWPDGNLQNGAGLPASPFRTDAPK